MISWKNLDTLAVYDKFMALKGRVNIVEAMAGDRRGYGRREWR